MTKEDAIFYNTLRAFLGVKPIAQDDRYKNQQRARASRSRREPDDAGARWFFSQVVPIGDNGRTYKKGSGA